MSWKCIILASRSAMASESSAKAGSKALRGNGASPCVLSLADSRKDERDDGRRGVVGRDVRVRDVERLRAWVASSADDIVHRRPECSTESHPASDIVAYRRLALEMRVNNDATWGSSSSTLPHQEGGPPAPQILQEVPRDSTCRGESASRHMVGEQYVA
jgi:hypothetical protein